MHILQGPFFEVRPTFWRTVLQELLDDHAWTSKLEGLFCDTSSVFSAVSAEVQQVQDVHFHAQLQNIAENELGGVLEVLKRPPRQPCEEVPHSSKILEVSGGQRL